MPPLFRRRARAALGAALSTTLALALTAAAPGAAAPADTVAAAASPNRYAATLLPRERFELAGLLVERHGTDGGRPLVLIPGLASGSWAWQDTIRAFAPSHPVYVLTLPGFDGRAPAGPAPFAAARAALARLIAERGLTAPVLVGHGMGGILALAEAQAQPRAVGGVVSIDGLPVMPGTEEMPPGGRARVADNMLMGAPRQAAAFASQQQTYLRTIGTLDMDRGDELAKLTARSDPLSSARYAAELLTLDLRPALPALSAPVLLLMPYCPLDAEQQGQNLEAKLGYYRALMAGTPKLNVVPVVPARHFAMFDQPQAVLVALKTFLDAP